MDKVMNQMQTQNVAPDIVSFNTILQVALENVPSMGKNASDNLQGLCPFVSLPMSQSACP